MRCGLPRRAGHGATLALLGCSWALGCLDAPPTFAPRGQIPPFVIAGEVLPPLDAVYTGPIPFRIDVPFRSEDVNIDLDARLYLDLVPGANQGMLALEQRVAAGVYADTTRSVSMDWTMELTGCHSLTLILTYFDNYDATGLPIDDTRAARVVWWLNVGDVNAGVTVASCPGTTQTLQ
jgi:hypothetical protein